MTRKLTYYSSRCGVCKPQGMDGAGPGPRHPCTARELAHHLPKRAAAERHRHFPWAQGVAKCLRVAPMAPQPVQVPMAVPMHVISIAKKATTVSCGGRNERAYPQPPFRRIRRFGAGTEVSCRKIGEMFV